MNRLVLFLVCLVGYIVLAASGCGRRTDPQISSRSESDGEVTDIANFPGAEPKKHEFSATVPVRMNPQDVASIGAWPIAAHRISRAGLAGLPNPTALRPSGGAARFASYTIDALGLAGDEYDPALPSSNISASVTSCLIFTPLWGSVSDPQISDAAYAIFRFQISDYPESGEPQTISPIWFPGSEPSDFKQVWVGLSDADHDRWVWFAAPEDGVITVDTLAEFQYPSGELLAAVVVLDSSICALSSLVIGESESRGTGGDPGSNPPGGDDTPVPPDNEVFPASIDYSPECSPVEDQGSSSSCTCYAVARGAFDFKLGQLYDADGWDFGNDFNLSSTQYLYVLTGEDQGRDCDDGRYTEGVIQYLISHGDSSKLHAGPGPCAHYWTGLADEDAEILRASLMQHLDPAGVVGVRKLKSALATHRRLPVLTMGFDSSFSHLQPGAVWYYAGQEIKGYHVVCIVGYDDAKQAFKVRNSWSTSWSDGGYGWIAYQTFVEDPPELALWCQTLSVDYSSAVAEHFCGADPKLDPPTGLTASDGTYVDFVRLSWQAAAGATGYKIFRDSQASPLVTLGNVLSWDDTALDDFESHIYWVSATGGLQESVLSEPDAGCLWTIAAPENLKASDGTNRHAIELTWNPQEHVTGYKVYRDGYSKEIASLGAVTDWVDYEVPDYGLHVYRIRALGPGQESSYSGTDIGSRGSEPVVISVSPWQGDPQTQVTFSAVIEGEAPTDYVWQFGGGAVPDLSSQAMPLVTLADAGTYFGELAVSNSAGSYVYCFTIQVGAPPDIGPWPMFQQDGFGRRCASVGGPGTNAEDWATPCGFPIPRSAAIGPDGTLYFSTSLALRALNSDGSYKWVYDGSFTTAPAVGTTGLIYVGASDGNMYGLLPDGTFRWKYQCSTGAITSAPTVGADGLIYVGAGNYIYTLRSNGTLRRSQYVAGPVEGSPAIGPGGEIYFGAGGYLYSYKHNGDFRWYTDLGDSVATGPAIATDGTVYAAADSTLCAVFPDGVIRWIFDCSDTTGSSPAIAPDGTVYITNNNGKLFAINPDGSERWTNDFAEPMWSTPAVDASGRVYLHGSQLYAVDPDGSIAWTLPAASNSAGAVIGADGTVYFGDEDGIFHAVGPGGG